ncbi:MAG: ferrochelatase [Salinisphaera sp.]|nr:ferrochelatase [Salinisphaera sp.]
MKQDRIGVLLVNLGTPDAPTTAAVRRYLAEFLSDPRVVEQPRWLWIPVLYGVILALRPRRSAAAYAKIWWQEGSPLLVIARRQAAALQRQLADRAQVTLAMRYGQPSLPQGLDQLRAAGCNRILLLPLYPQYSATTTATGFDRVASILRGWRDQPALRTVVDYHAEPGYIQALAQSLRDYWAEHGRSERLLMSFHGIPQRYANAGDPYPDQCRATADALARALELNDEDWQCTFQSRFGREPWLQPYTDKTLQAWARAGVTTVDVVCPGFSADCLETLEEIAIANRALFHAGGGRDLRYIPALNDRDDHIAFLADLARRELGGWLD